MLAVLLRAAHAANYAVLAATPGGGADPWMAYYRMQADIYHAYHVLVSGGVPAENIIVLSFDDIANNSNNPFPGQIFNRPSQAGRPDQDVRAGVRVDYSGMNLTPATFLQVITGNATGLEKKGSGRVLRSGSGDHVFVNMVGHGRPGSVAFPYIRWDPPMHVIEQKLYREDLWAALHTMHSNRMYSKLTFYLEACHSGSMFEGMPSGLDVYVTTAANAHESSHAVYCPWGSRRATTLVKGVDLHTCLGDAYSENWMHNAESSDLSEETLEEQYKKVRAATTRSQVMQFWDFKHRE